jgi:predicted hydrocarbon binding protein
MVDDRKYAFSWDLLGDIELGRPNLGNTTRLEVYRLMQFCFRDVLEQRFGAQAADDVFYEAGKLAGAEFAAHLLSRPEELGDFVAELQRVLRELGIGILRVEKADPERGEFVVTVSEDLDCSGLPESGESVCVYDEGFIAALLESYTGRRFVVKEVDCWCTGDRTCRFTAEVDAA